jgi:hypothetical protein
MPKKEQRINRMYGFLRASVALCFLLGAGAISAQAVTEPIDFDCSAAGGRYTVRRFVSDGMSVSGTLQLVDVQKHDVYLPNVDIAVLGNSKSKRTGLSVTIHRDTPDILSIAVRRRYGAQSVFARFPKTDYPFPFHVSFAPSGELSVKFADASLTIKIPPFHVEEVGLYCSTGSFKFADVVISTDQASGSVP